MTTTEKCDDILIISPLGAIKMASYDEKKNKEKAENQKLNTSIKGKKNKRSNSAPKKSGESL